MSGMDDTFDSLKCVGYCLFVTELKTLQRKQRKRLEGLIVNRQIIKKYYLFFIPNSLSTYELLIYAYAPQFEIWNGPALPTQVEKFPCDVHFIALMC